MDRFDLENHITNLHSIVDSLNDISYGILEGEFTKDETVNAVDGLAVLTKAKIEKLFDTFVRVFELDGYTQDLTENIDPFNTQDVWV
jgi:hypothetical protein